MGKLGDAIKNLIEKRDSQRHCYEVEISYAFHQKAFQDYIRDISRGGAFIRTKNQIAVGNRISLSIPVDRPGCEMRFTGEIARKNPEGIGIRFVNIRPEDEVVIGRFIDTIESPAVQ